MRALIVNVPIRLDNGEMAHFEGYRVQHNLPAARARAASASTRG
jgi:glutamate dehydrogenase/leucine dehydrogenase